MNIVVLHGQMHKGSTYNITKLFLENISDEKTKIEEFFLPKDGPSFCIGCFNCFTKGEEYCPHANIVQPVANAILESDLLILDSPCYVYGMSGQLKTLLDHLGYLWMPHRPHERMFSKVGLVISTAAGAGSKKVTKSLKDNLFYFGVPKIYSFSRNVGASSWDTVDKKRKAAMKNDIAKLSTKISKQVLNVTPGPKTKLMFNLMRISQKSNTWNPTDKNHWLKSGWLERNRPW